MAEPECEGLRLEAQDADDLAVVSAVLQDAVTRFGEMSYSERGHRFAAVFNRFRWEHEQENGPEIKESSVELRHQRVRTRLHFAGVLSAQLSGLEPSNSEQILELLALICEPREGGAATITLVFAGSGLVRLKAECIECRLHDFGAPWPTPHKPSHDLAGDA